MAYYCSRFGVTRVRFWVIGRWALERGYSDLVRRHRISLCTRASTSPGLDATTPSRQWRWISCWSAGLLRDAPRSIPSSLTSLVVSFGFSRTFHLRRRPPTVPLHRGTRRPDSTSAPSGSVTSTSAVARQQPNGLMMRFRPPGSRPIRQDDVSPDGAAVGDPVGPSPPPPFRIPSGIEGSSNGGPRPDASACPVDHRWSQPTNQVDRDSRPNRERRRTKKEKKHLHQEDVQTNGPPESSRVDHINDPHESSPNIERSQEEHPKPHKDRGPSSKPAKEQPREADAERLKRRKRTKREPHHGDSLGGGLAR